MVLETTKNNGEWVRATVEGMGYAILKNSYWDESTQEYLPTNYDEATGEYYNIKSMEVNVNLPAGPQALRVDWLDSAGEIWRPRWRQQHSQAWQQIVEPLQRGDGIVLILPPYRDLPHMQPERADEFPSRQQWCNRFQRWVEFFQQECPRATKIVVCIHKADLFCDLAKEEFELSYHPAIARKNWSQRHEYVSEKFFRPVRAELVQLNLRTNALVRCFITSIYSRKLLELPWIYLASHLGY